LQKLYKECQNPNKTREMWDEESKHSPESRNGISAEEGWKNDY
jgi:hypothetical protein